MKNISIDDAVTEIMNFYNTYDLHVAGKIQDIAAFDLIQTIENKFDVDSFKLSDGTRIWNLLRIFIYGTVPVLLKKSTKEDNFKRFLVVFKEGFLPLTLPERETTMYAFSSGESRKLTQGTYYDIYLDPLYDVLGDALCILEWPEKEGIRRNKPTDVYSKNFVPLHIPIYTHTFWNLFFYQLLGKRFYSIEPRKDFEQLIEYISKISTIEKITLTNSIYDFITVFFEMKKFFHTILQQHSPKAVLFRTGYGRFPMALSQACRELKIPTIELQHGLITKYLPAYVRASPTTNHDCVPAYLLTHGEKYSDIVKEGNIFDKDNVVTVGFPYLEKNILDVKKTDTPSDTRYSRFEYTVLFTSQGFIANKIQNFVEEVSLGFEKTGANIGIIFKPHHNDPKGYSELNDKYKNIILEDKYADTFKIMSRTDIHATVYSTSALEAMALGKPNIFVDIYGLTDVKDSIFIVKSPSDFVERVQTIVANYDRFTEQTRSIAALFFKPHSEKNLREFFTNKGFIPPTYGENVGVNR